MVQTYVLGSHLEKHAAITKNVMLISLAEFKQYGLLQQHVNPEVKWDLHVNLISIVKQEIFAGKFYQQMNESVLKSIMHLLELNSFGIVKFIH